MGFSRYTNVALAAAEQGASVLIKYYKKFVNIEYKNEIDPVTKADKTSQKIIIKMIKSVFPQHGILAEEDGINKIDKDYCWIIDPLDGTVNFVHGVPIFCVSIGLKHKNEVISGVIYSKITREIFIAEKNKGAWLNGEKINVSKIKDAIRSLAVTGFPYYSRKNNTKAIKIFKNIMLKSQGIRRLGSAALSLAYVACGRFDFFWEEGLKPWDIAAGILMVKEANGKVSDYNGKNTSIFEDTLLASNGSKIHKELLKVING
jgi:myo-inositol-1(or 4)-monophosphatase